MRERYEMKKLERSLKAIQEEVRDEARWMWCKGKLNFLVFTFRANERRVEDSTAFAAIAGRLFGCASLTVPDFKRFYYFYLFYSVRSVWSNDCRA